MPRRSSGGLGIGVGVQICIREERYKQKGYSLREEKKARKKENGGKEETLGRRRRWRTLGDFGGFMEDLEKFQRGEAWRKLGNSRNT